MDEGSGGDDAARELAALRRQNADLKAQVTRLTESATRSRARDMTWVYALEGSGDGVWDWNAVTYEVYFSPRWKEMLGFAVHEIADSLAEWERRVHPEDRDAVFEDLRRHFAGEVPYYRNEHRVQCRDGSWKWILDRGKVVSWTEDGKPLRVVGTHSDISVRKSAEQERERLIAELSEAKGRIKTLSGLLPICAWCRKIRDEKGHWGSLEDYVRTHTDAMPSHGICPGCARQYLPEGDVKN